MFALFVVTLSLYRLYWLASTRDEMVEKGNDVPSIWLYIGIYAVTIGSFLLFVLTNSAVAIILFYLAILFISPLVGLWYWKYAQATDVVTKSKMSFPVAMLILLAVPDGFDMLLVQDSFNKTK